MKTRIISSSFLAAALLVFGIGAAAQRSTQAQTRQDQTSQSQSMPGMMGGGMMGQGMGMGQGNGMGQGMGRGQGMMGTMGQMRTHHQQMTTLMNKLMQSMAAIQGEKDPAALKSMLAEHQELLNQMHTQMMQQGRRMRMMRGQMMRNCPAAAATDTAKPPAK